MQSLLIREQYKVIRVIHAQENYAALEAVDIQDRENTSYLLNVYEGEYLKPYLRCFHELRNCSAYREMFVWKGSLVSVFSFREGPNIDQVFYRGAQVDWRRRLEVAGALFHQTLAMWDYPARISCAALFSRNIRIQQEQTHLTLNFMILPMEEPERRELVLLLEDQVKKVLLTRWSSPREERRFVRGLSSGKQRSAVGAYGEWNAAQSAIRSAYETLENKNVFGRTFSLLKINLGDWMERRKEARKGGSRV